MGKPHLSSLKHKVATQVGVNLNDGYNGNITTKQAGLVGGNMVRELIITAQQNLSNIYTPDYATTYANPTATTYNTNIF